MVGMKTTRGSKSSKNHRKSGMSRWNAKSRLRSSPSSATAEAGGLSGEARKSGRKKICSLYWA
jgi:hypothetical protein